MNQWKCCRTCLNSENLHPIFSDSENDEIFLNSVFIAVGIKIQENDNLPHHICTKCKLFVNEINEFRIKANDVQTELLQRSQTQIIHDVKEETFDYKLENDIKALEDCDDDYKHNDNDVIDDKEITKNIESVNNLEPCAKNIVESPKNSITNKKKTSSKVSRRNVRSKKENGTAEVKQKKERVKEEIECEYCHKVLTSKLSLRNHYKIHTGFDVVCEHCGKKFITRRLLLMHCRAKHGYEKTDKCSYCDYKASNAEQVKIHERLHTGEKPYVCKDCGTGFHRKSSYLQHIAIHLPEKTVQCDQCPAKFKSVTLMRIHKNRHRLPVHSFRCSLCGNSFARRRNVSRHVQRIHGITPELQHIHRVKISQHGVLQGG